MTHWPKCWLRRTHRRYTDESIADDLLDVLFATAFSASTKSDLQQASVVVVKNKEKREAIGKLIPRMPWITAAPVFMVWIGDSRRIRRICELRGKPFGNVIIWTGVPECWRRCCSCDANIHTGGREEGPWQLPN